MIRVSLGYPGVEMEGTGGEGAGSPKAACAAHAS